MGKTMNKKIKLAVLNLFYVCVCLLGLVPILYILLLSEIGRAHV